MQDWHAWAKIPECWGEKANESKKEVKGDRMVTSKRRKFADIDSSVYRASTISALR